LFNCQENLPFYFTGTDIKLITYFISLFIYIIQASSEHPLAKAVLAYARHFHFFDDSSATTENNAKSGWLFDVSDFSALPGRGVQCFINGQRILVLSLYYCNLSVLVPKYIEIRFIFFEEFLTRGSISSTGWQQEFDGGKWYRYFNRSGKFCG
jgi:hypothetical protein